MSGNNLNPISACKINKKSEAEYKNYNTITNKFNYVQYIGNNFIYSALEVNAHNNNIFEHLNTWNFILKTNIKKIFSLVEYFKH